MIDMEMERFISHTTYQPDLICSVPPLAFKDPQAQIDMPREAQARDRFFLSRQSSKQKVKQFRVFNGIF